MLVQIQDDDNIVLIFFFILIGQIWIDNIYLKTNI